MNEDKKEININDKKPLSFENKTKKRWTNSRKRKKRTEQLQKDAELLVNKTSVSANKVPVLVNGSFEFDKELLKPTYRFQSGMPGNSYAFYLARAVGLPESLLAKAKQYLGKQPQQLEKSIARLERRTAQAKKLATELDKSLQEAEKQKEDYAKRIAEVAEKKKDILASARADAAEILQRATSTVEEIVQSLKAENKTVAEVSRLRKEFREAVVTATSAVAESKRTGEHVISLKAGDKVRMLGNNETGEVLESDDADAMALVAFAGKRFKVKYSVLEYATSDVPSAPRHNYVISKLPTSKKQTRVVDMSAQLDLRGFTADAARVAVDGYVAQAISLGRSPFNIIHGKGTGRLRQVVREVLSGYGNTLTYRLGELYEGGEGVTVVYLE